jgi:hypothetical protein
MFRSLSFHSRCPSKLYHKLIVMRTSLCRCRTSVDFSAPVSPSTSCSSLRRCPPPPPVVEVLDYVADGVRYRGREPGVVEYLPIMETGRRSPYGDLGLGLEQPCSAGEQHVQGDGGAAGVPLDLEIYVIFLMYFMISDNLCHTKNLYSMMYFLLRFLFMCDIFMFVELLNNIFLLIIYFNLIKLSYNIFVHTCIYFYSHR